MAVLGVVALPATLGAAGPDPGHCDVVDSSGFCLVAAVDPGRPGGPLDTSHNPARHPNPPAISTLAPTPPKADKKTSNGRRTAPATPGVLAQEAIQFLQLPRPGLQLSVQDRAYVGVPLWLWVAGGRANTGPLTATATAGAAQVTATGRLARTVWSMGPPNAVVTCPGTGTPWSGASGSSPDCSYTYTQRSLPERTAGRGTWPVTVTSVWQVTWTGIEGGAPVIGTEEVPLTANRALPVGELQVLVTGSGA